MSLTEALGSFGASGSLLKSFWALFFHACIGDGVQKGSWRLLASIFPRFCGVWTVFGEGLGRVLGRDFGGFWVVLGYSGFFWILGALLDDLGSILADAGCSFACFCVLLLIFSSFCLLVLAIACHCWLLVALAYFSGFCLLLMS